jgi:hypothetical protein
MQTPGELVSSPRIAAHRQPRIKLVDSPLGSSIKTGTSGLLERPCYLAGPWLKGAMETKCGGWKGLLRRLWTAGRRLPNRGQSICPVKLERLLTALQAVLMVRRPRGRSAKVESGFAGRSPARADGVDFCVRVLGLRELVKTKLVVLSCR